MRAIFLFQLVAVEHRLASIVHLKPIDETRHDQLDEFLGAIEGFLLVNDDRVDILGEGIADGTNHHVALFVHIAWTWGLLESTDDDFPESQQVSECRERVLFEFVLVLRFGR